MEIYQDKRFFTITGHRLNQYPKNINNKIDEINEVYEEFLKPEPAKKENKKKENTKTREEKYESSDIPKFSDDEIIKMASKAKNREKFKALFSGDTSGYDSASEADLALCSILAFWSGKNRSQIDRIFRKSGLI